LARDPKRSKRAGSGETWQRKKAESTISAKPIMITKFQRLGKKYGYCDEAKGFFIRTGPDWTFHVYFADEPGEDKSHQNIMGLCHSR
jgi:hypothetical protein